MSNSDSTTAWVTVAEAADKAQVDSGTVRQWYRAGRIPTRRAEGERGAFLVPLDLVLSLVRPSDEVTAPNASSSIEAADLGGAGRAEEIEALQQELAAAADQLDFLRGQLAEVTAENRTLKEQLHAAEDHRADLRAQLADAVDDRKGVEARLLTVEAELSQLRKTAVRSSITDNAWLDLETPAYESPVRRQATPTTEAMDGQATPPGGPTAPFGGPGTNELADLLIPTRHDDGTPDDTEQSGAPAAQPDVPDDDLARRAIWTDETPHPALGESPDDLLPEPEKKGRFGKR